MKRLLTAFVFGLLILGAGSATAQEYVAAPVTVSKEKVKLNGKIYLSHVVLERQTLYGISQAYKVSVDDIYEANPSLRETGLQKNAIILIPWSEAAANEVAAPAEETPVSYTKHVVKWYEDIDDIARRYDVSVKDIMEFNGLSSRKLTTRQELKIPLPKVEEAAPAPEPETEPEAEPETVTEEQTPEPVQESVPEEVVFKDEVSFSLILPLNASGKTSEVNMDFYSGVLMAMKDLEGENIRMNLDVYDLYAGIPPVETLTSGDFVLGPVASRDIEAILQRVDGAVPLISPLDQKAGALSASYTNFIQSPTPADNQFQELAAWVKEECAPADRIILVTEKGASSTSAAVGIRSALARNALTYDILNYAISEGREVPDTLGALMTKGGVNRVVVASESEAFVSDIVLNLGIMLDKSYPIVMYAPSRLRTFESVDGSEYHRLNLHMCAAYYVDYDDPKVDAFVRAYRALFKTEPSQFAFQGYDTSMYYARAVKHYGSAWKESLGSVRGEGLHTDFLFDSDGSGNRQNKALRRIVYNTDYTTSLVKP